MEKKKKKGGIGAAVLVVLLVAANLISEDTDALPAVLAIAFLFIIIAVVIGVVRTRVARAKAGRGSQKIHSHDRLHPNTAAPCTDPDEHWKKQLDGFLEAGIIEKDEYRVLMNRRSQQYSGK